VQIIKAGFTIETEVDGVKILKEIEQFARNCYKSEGKATETSYLEFVSRLLHTRKHEGIADHHVVSCRIIIDRGVGNEVVRHRIAAYLQESTRYCDYVKAGEIQVIDVSRHMTETQLAEWILAMEDAERHYNNLRGMGCKPEIARDVLPLSLKTEIIMTLNLTSWRNFFKKRTAPNAHPQLREISIPMLVEFKRLIPVMFDDIEVKA
jgi:thymidylate synthase (FAD)